MHHGFHRNMKHCFHVNTSALLNLINKLISYTFINKHLKIVKLFNILLEIWFVF